MEEKVKPKTNYKRLMGLLVIFAILVGGYFMLPSGPKPHVHAKLKDLKINALELDTLYAKNGETVEDIKKKSHVLMVLFTLNCLETQENIKMLNALHKREDIAVVGYLMGGISKAESFAKRYGVEFPIANPSVHYKQTFEPNVIPTTFLVSTNNLKIKKKYVGILFPQSIINDMAEF